MQDDVISDVILDLNTSVKNTQHPERYVLEHEISHPDDIVVRNEGYSILYRYNYKED